MSAAKSLDGFIETTVVRKFAFGTVNHKGEIDLKLSSKGIPWEKHEITLMPKKLQLEGNTKNIFMEAKPSGDDKYIAYCCSTTASRIEDIENSGVSTKGGTALWFAFEL